MNKNEDVKIVCFNGNEYVEDDAVKEGTFLDLDYGEGLYLQNPVEALAYSLIMANKDVLMTEVNKPKFGVKKILDKVDDLVDFPDNYSKKDFIRDVKRTFAQKVYNPADFMKNLEKNIQIGDPSLYNYKMIRKAFVKKIEKVLNINKNTKKESAFLQCLSIEEPPKGFSKIELMDNAINFIDELCTKFVDDNPQFFEQTDFSKESWYEDFMLNRKIDILKGKKENLQDNEKVDAFYQMKAQFNSFEDLVIIVEQDEEYIQDKVLEIVNDAKNSHQNDSSQNDFSKSDSDYRQLY